MWKNFEYVFSKCAFRVCVCVLSKKNHIPLVWAWQRGLFSWCFHLGQAVNCFWWPSRGLGLESGRSWPRGPEASPRTTPFLCQNDFFIVTAAVFFFWPCSGLDGKAGSRRPGGRGVGVLNVLLMYTSTLYSSLLLFVLDVTVSSFLWLGLFSKFKDPFLPSLHDVSGHLPVEKQTLVMLPQTCVCIELRDSELWPSQGLQASDRSLK